jgi:hypothetical protein
MRRHSDPLPISGWLDNRGLLVFLYKTFFHQRLRYRFVGRGL